MAEGTGMGPVAAFCAELAELQRRSGRSHASLAHELNISRGHLYTILKGEVKRPPDWNRVVEPFVRACGADREEVAQWRKRHDVLVQVVEQLRRERRRGDPALDEAEPRVDSDEPDERPPPARDYAPRGRRRLIIAGALVLILIAALAGAAVWYSGRDRGAEANPGPCFSDAPPAGSDLMDVPHYQPGGESKYIDDWWSSDARAELGCHVPAGLGGHRTRGLGQPVRPDRAAQLHTAGGRAGLQARHDHLSGTGGQHPDPGAGTHGSHHLGGGGSTGRTATSSDRGAGHRGPDGPQR